MTENPLAHRLDYTSPSWMTTPLGITFRALPAVADGCRDQPEPNAMVVSTVDAEGRPTSRDGSSAARIDDDGALVFFTNRQSRKGRALAGTRRCRSCSPGTRCSDR